MRDIKDMEKTIKIRMQSKIVKFLDLAIEYLIYGLIFFLPISIAGISSFAGVAVVLFLVKQILSPDFSAIKSNKMFFLIFLVFFIFMGLSLLNSGPLLEKSFKALLLKWGKFPLIIWALLDTFRDTRRIVKAVWVFFFSAALVGLTTFSQKFFDLEFLRGRAFSGIVTGPFKHKNDLASYLTCIIPVVLSLGLWKWKQIFLKVVFFLIATMLMVVSFWTFSRGGWVGLMAGFISVAFLTNYSRLGKKTFWLLFLIGNIFFISVMSFVLMSFQNRGASGRFSLYRGAWKMIIEHPFLGKGLGTFMDYCPQYTNNFGVYYAHNCFLQIWAESGIFSLLSFVLLVGYVLYKSMRVTFRIPISVDFFILIGLNSGLLAFLVHSFFDTHFYSFQLSFLFWVLLGLNISLYSTRDKVPYL